jgi:hypothetical protein
MLPSLAKDNNTEIGHCPVREGKPQKAAPAGNLFFGAKISKQTLAGEKKTVMYYTYMVI